MSENKQYSDTWIDSDKLKHQLINESRHRHMVGNILFSLMCLLAVVIVCLTIWIYWFQ
jgi:hypothetical protein